MSRNSHFRFGRWHFALFAALLWVALSLGWSSYLLHSAFHRTLDQQLAQRTSAIGTILRESMALPVPLTQPTSQPKSTTLAAETNPLRRHVENFNLQSQVEQIKRADMEIAYLMLWTPDGIVIAHTRRDLRGNSLDPTKWPALDFAQSQRITNLTDAEIGKTIIDVIDVTVPLRSGSTVLGFVSLGYPQQWVTERFWETQRRAIYFAIVFTMLGTLIIITAVHVSSNRLDRSKREISQSALARTSLLTERGMLASVLAHEVRSPLTALRFNLHSLRSLVASQSVDVDRQVSLVDRCEREIRRLDGMLNDFLLRTQVIGPVEHTSVNTVVTEAIAFLRPALERKNVRPTLHLDPADPHVHAHADELRQVILNLAANAQDAMPKGGTLAISTVAEENTVALLIRDSGTGIPPELHERIFEPFFSTKPNGSGLGLALVRRVVSGAGGTIFCESAVGDSGKNSSGTTFRIMLPRAEPGTTGTPGDGYAHKRQDAELSLSDSPEIVIDNTAARSVP